MSPRRLLALFAPALMITVAIAASEQTPQAAASDSTRCPTVLANEAIIDPVAAKLSEVIIAKIQTLEDKLQRRLVRETEPRTRR